VFPHGFLLLELQPLAGRTLHADNRIEAKVRPIVPVDCHFKVRLQRRPITAAFAVPAAIGRPRLSGKPPRWSTAFSIRRATTCCGRLPCAKARNARDGWHLENFGGPAHHAEFARCGQLRSRARARPRFRTPSPLLGSFDFPLWANAATLAPKRYSILLFGSDQNLNLVRPHQRVSP
jgi:hypothetical protein